MQTQLIIDNTTRDARGGRTFERRNPLTGDVVTEGAAASVEDAVDAVESAAAAFATWSTTGPSTRRAILLKAADIIERRTPGVRRGDDGRGGRRSALGRLQRVPHRAAIPRGRGPRHPDPGRDAADRQAGNPVHDRAPTRRRRAQHGAVERRGGAGGALDRLSHRLRQHRRLPCVGDEPANPRHRRRGPARGRAARRVLNFLTSSPDDSDRVVEAIIAHPAVRRVNFTGSTTVGRIIAEKAARHLKPALLELGGKAPFVVLDDADLDGAVNAAVFGSFLYQGQICMSTERFVVDEAVADEFVAKFAARAKSLAAGDPLQDASCVVGPMIRAESGTRINGLLDDALAKGAEVVVGGHADGAAMSATIVDKVAPHMDIYDQETFGPITTVVRVSGVDEAVQVANDTEYGLAAAVFGGDSTRALQVAMRIQAGHVHVNGATVQNEAQAPYGGMKASGYGRFDGRAVINEFTELKWITVEPADQPYPF